MTPKTTLREVVSTVMNEEMRRKASGEVPSLVGPSAALSVESRGRNNNQGISSSRNSRSKSRTGRKIECWHCHKQGHMKNQCEEYKQEKQGSQGANVVSTETHEDEYCLSAGVEVKPENWFVDSGASYHYTEKFEDYASGNYGTVSMGNGIKCPVVGKGTIRLSQNGGPKCWYCYKKGHVKRQCKALMEKKQGKSTSEANMVTNESLSDEYCLSARVELGVQDWCIDSGASFHCTSRREVFEDYKEGSFGDVIVGNGQRCPVVGTGTIRVKACEDKQIVLRAARHVPDLKENLISASKLDEEGLSTTFGKGEWKITAGTEVVASGKREGSLYLLRGMDYASPVVVPSPESRCQLRGLAMMTESVGDGAGFARSVGVGDQERDSNGEHEYATARIPCDMVETPEFFHDDGGKGADMRVGVDTSARVIHEGDAIGTSQSVLGVSPMEASIVGGTSLALRGFQPCPVLEEILRIGESCNTESDMGESFSVIRALSESWWGTPFRSC